MKLDYSARMALSNLKHSKLRTWLTITGIVIGVAAVVLIIAVGNGLQESVQQQLSGFGADLITISPGFSRAGAFGFRPAGGGGEAQTQAQNITVRDLQAVKLVKNVKQVTGVVSAQASLEFAGEDIKAQVRGVDPLLWRDFSNDALEEGRILEPGDANAIVIGSRVAEQFFTKPVVLNSLVNINGKAFRVVGILASSGSMGGSDNTILMPIVQARAVLEGFTVDQFSTIYVKASNLEEITQTVADLEQTLLYSRHLVDK
ncbi:MAG: ABC transporter permease, partial [Candidatus Micrarchaeota archaeon]